MRLNHSTFFNSVLAATYSLSHVLRATIACFLEHQLTGAPEHNSIKPSVDFMSGLSSKSASAYDCMGQLCFWFA